MFISCHLRLYRTFLNWILRCNGEHEPFCESELIVRGAGCWTYDMVNDMY